MTGLLGPGLRDPLIPASGVAPPAAAAPPAPPAWAAPLLSGNIPAASSQVIIVRSPSPSSTTNTVSLWTRAGTGWREDGTQMPGHDGEGGWSAHRSAGDLRTPLGVYSLTYAGGRLPNPGTREPYEHSSSYFYTAGRFLGHSTFGVFDYVVAIDFNRVPGSPVSSTNKPNGPQSGGDVWLHVDNGAPTLGCVTVPRSDMAAILKWLDPSQHPVIVLHAG
jgi:L,D-peptidoglycan transpeptidase YkuD (ErfK/YbiS/YcfS/YnhG family)